MTLRVEPLAAQSSETRRRVAALLVDAFVGFPESWNTLEEAEEEVAAALGVGRMAFVALTATGEPRGWIGGISTYEGRVWELHPLAVAPDAQRTGIGRMLVERLEREVGALGSDDVAGLTSLGGKDLFPGAGPPADLRSLGNHPFGFYQRLGYEVVNVVPDANGFGRPDIMMAKRIRGGPCPGGPASV